MNVLVANQQDVMEIGERWRRLVEECALAALATITEWWRIEGREPEEWVRAVIASPEAEVSVAFVDDEAIHELNREYRNVDRPTDVLSFPMMEEPTGEEALLGDIVISLPTAVRQAGEYGHSPEREIGFLTVHGMLHLLGMDHEEEADAVLMRRLEEATLTRLSLARWEGEV